MARPNMKSVRLSNEALTIVEQAEGKGFNDKFEGLIFDYKNTIPTRQAKLEAIEKRIAEKQKQFETLSDLEHKVNHMAKQLSEIATLIPSVYKSLNNVSQELSQEQATGEESEIHPEVKHFNNALKKFMMPDIN